MVISDDTVLHFFRDELSLAVTISFKPVAVELDTPLQEYAEWDELPYCIEKFGKKFDIDVSAIDFDAYYPWKRNAFFRKWFTQEPIKQVSKPLTIRMFAESAKAGRWLYD
ncbi:DUF1493 family protein [Pluralibacter gergoviae]|uniref:DUF1493 family protein n=1 Tax=Pluralibacter gergoviae TaxID=61647 RepID=UPI000A56F121|nr:DUF1493 family protein [Pluralibacter gergoviae]